MSELKITRGVPASGKSTWAKEWVANDPERRIRVNRDDLRAMMFEVVGVGTFPQEKAVSAAEQAIVRSLLGAGMDVVVDATHLRAKFAKAWLEFDAEVEFVDFPITLDDAYERDFQRGDYGGRSVGPEVLKMFFDKFIGKDGISLPPVPTKEINSVKFKQVEAYDVRKLDAIIVDIDGTLAHIPEGGRSPYDGHRVGEDVLDHTIAYMVNGYHSRGVRVLITSGRDEKYRDVTVAWLTENNVRHDALIMRPLDDTRNDAIVKDELYEQHIAPHHNVLFVLDDRDRVVDMWRAKGLKTLQVQPGNF